MTGFNSKLTQSGINIYNSDNTVGANRVATLTDELKFVVPSSGSSSGVKIGDVLANSSGYTLYVKAASISQPIAFQGADNSTNVLISLLNSSGTDVGNFRNNGNTSLAIGTTSLFSLGASTLASTKLYVKGIGTTVATTNQRWDNQASSHLMSLTDNGELRFGIFSSTFLFYNSGSGAFQIGDPVRINDFYGTTHRFNGPVWLYDVRSTIAANTNYQMNQFGILFRADGSAGTDQTHFNFNVATGASTANSVVFKTGIGATDFMTIYGDQRIKLGVIPIYADDAAAGAGGLTTGFIYRTATGELRIKL